ARVGSEAQGAVVRSANAQPGGRRAVPWASDVDEAHRALAGRAHLTVAPARQQRWPAVRRGHGPAGSLVVAQPALVVAVVAEAALRAGARSAATSGRRSRRSGSSRQARAAAAGTGNDRGAARRRASRQTECSDHDWVQAHSDIVSPNASSQKSR